MKHPILKAHQLSFSYPHTPILHQINLCVEAGEIIVLIGPNGCGKTTLLKNLSGVLKPQDRGRCIQIDLKTLDTLSNKELAKILAAVEQHVQPGFDFTVRQIVELGRMPHQTPFGGLKAHDHAAIQKALERTGTTQFSERSMGQLSSGERQRVWLAMALAQEPKLLLLDEPTSHLDLKYQIELLQTVRDLAKDGLSVIMSLHDLTIAGQYADKLMIVQKGSVVAFGTPKEVLTSARLKEVYEVDVEVLFDKRDRFWGILPHRQ